MARRALLRADRACGFAVAWLLVLAVLAWAPGGASARVIRVGTYHGIPGEFRDIQSAVNAARPGDWILIAPGDYHEAKTVMPSGGAGDDRAGAGVLITTPGLWLRGMNRNTVWIDGTKPGSSQCSSAAASQDFGPLDSGGKPGGRNGVLIYKAPGVTVENLSVCNFLNGDHGGGNEIWWDAGQSTGTQSSLGVWSGSYLTATSSYFKDNNSPSAGYGIYSSNTSGPGYGVFANDYASNMNDSAFYVGACPDCNVTLNGVHGENSPQGYSGTNSSGHVLVENSEFDNNMVGFATGDLNNDDAPGPQDGTCPGNAVNPNAPAGVQRTHVCWVFINNYVHDNNNPNVPSTGIAGSVPVGTGVLVYGGRHDVFVHNRFVHNGAWGILFTPYPDTEQPPPVAHCNGGQDLSSPGSPLCYYDDWGNELAFNSFTNNGFFGNASNGDIGELSQQGPNYNPDSNCFHDNSDTGGTLTSDPATVENYNVCGQTYPPAGDGILASQELCDTQIGPCPPIGATYPRASNIALTLPPAQPTMPNPCSGVLANPWCSGQVTTVAACVEHTARITALLAPRDHLLRLSGRARGARGLRVKRRGRSLIVHVPRRVESAFRVSVFERIRVRHHTERFRFTLLYHAC